MGKVNQISNGDQGKTARDAWNEAMKSAEIDSTMTGTGEVATPLGVDTAWLTTFIDALIAASPITKSYSIGKVPSGTHYVAGYYSAPATDANLSQASTTQTYGVGNVSYASHAFIVAGGAGTTDAGVVGLRVTGTRIQDDGTRTPGYQDVLSADITTLNTDDFIEGVKFIGQVTFELYTVSGSPTTYSLNFNYGLNKYEDFGNRSFQVTDFEVVGEANTTDSGFNLELLKQDDQGWTYSAAAFVPGGTVIYNMNTDHNTEINVQAGENFGYKRADGATLVDGTASEGVIVRITQGSNNTIEHADFHIGVLLTDSIIT